MLLPENLTKNSEKKNVNTEVPKLVHNEGIRLFRNLNLRGGEIFCFSRKRFSDGAKFRQEFIFCTFREGILLLFDDNKMNMARKPEKI